ncbi:MAG: ParB/RepB/Spo0J family partition protein [Bacilli bacterium]|nr:ParB/RepB/Spo0J family partition protein [Bacilli bacterium]
MENKRRALGKGLEELFNAEPLNFEAVEKRIVETTPKEEIVDIKLDELRANPYQPRKRIDEEGIKELAQSIKEHGVFQPIIVKKSIKGYDIIAGERRVRASQQAGLEKIPAIVRSFSDNEMMEIALLENLQRENLTPIEEAEAYRKMINSLNITQEELGQKLGKSRSHITNILGLLSLPAVVQNLLLENKIAMGHARVLSKLENEEQIITLAQQTIDKGLSVRQLESLVKFENFKRKKPLQRRKEERDPAFLVAEKLLRDKFGSKIRVTNSKIEIIFDSYHDLNRILDIMNIKMEE